jgi:LPS sulfotransferase NodH
MINNFIILADARTGSHMLQSALEKHPQINCFGEILNPKSNDSKISDRTEIEAIYHAFSYPNSGFIVHRHRSFTHVWENLSKRPNLKVINLLRKNHLLRFASLTIAKKTKNWIDLDGSKNSKISVKFNLEAYRKILNQYNINRKKEEYFLDKQRINVVYENLLSNWDAEIARILCFLNVELKKIQPSTHKQETRDIKEIFSNYEDISL